MHGTAISVAGEGVLLLGPSGIGKTDLALRLIHEGASLIADDQVTITKQGDVLVLDAPTNIAGIIELNGIGLISMPYSEHIPLKLVVQCASPTERMPTRESFIHEGLSVESIILDPRHSSAPAKLALYLHAMREGRVLPEDWAAQASHTEAA